MTIEVLALVLNNSLSPQELHPYEFSILVSLANYSSLSGTNIWPKRSTISRMTKLSESTVKRYLNSLEQKGYIKRKHRFINGKQTSNEYRLNVRKLAHEAIKELPEEDDTFEGFDTDPPVHLGGSGGTPGGSGGTPGGSDRPTDTLLNPYLNSSSGADKNEEKERACAMARLAELHKGEQAKLKSRPRPPTEDQDPPFRYEPTPIHPIADDDKPLSGELSDNGVSKGCILALLRAHPNRAHIRQSLKKLQNAIKTKGVKSPDGFMRHVMNDPYEEVKATRNAPKGVSRTSQIDEETRKAKAEWEAGEKRIEAIRANPEAMESRIAGLRNAMKQAKASALAAH